MTIDQTGVSRRTLLAQVATWPLAGAGLLTLTACGEQEKVVVCAGPNNLTFAENSLRQASHYVEHAADPAKECTKCGFFKPAADGGVCGACEIFQGPVNAKATCDSFSVKAA
jgi:hypothetical protein